MLIFGKVKKKHKPQGNPPWLTWGVTLLVGYMLYSQYTDKNSQYNKQKQGAETVEVAVDGSTDSSVSAAQSDASLPVAQPVKDEIALTASQKKLPDSVNITGDIEGRGEGASCGHLLNVVYDEVAVDNAAFKPKDAVTLELRAGAKPSEIWHNAFDGMKIGGVRQITVPSGAVYDAKELAENNLKEADLLQYKVELKSISPVTLPEQITMQTVNIQAGTGDGLVCNQQVNFALILWGEDGRKLYENDSLTTIVGNVDYFYGLDKALIGMKNGGERMAMIPPSYSVLNEKALDIKKVIKPNQMIVAQIRVQSIK